MKANGIDPPLPDLLSHYLVDLLMEIGPTIGTAMGVVSIGWDTLEYWVNRTGVPLSPWEARTIRRMSQAFLVMADKAKDPKCPSPVAVEMTERNRAAVAAQVDAFFGALADKKRPA